MTTTTATATATAKPDIPKYSRSALECWIAAQIEANPALASQIAANPAAGLQALSGKTPPPNINIQVVQETAQELILVQRAHGAVSTENFGKITNKRVLLTELANRQARANSNFWSQLQTNAATALAPLRYTPTVKVSVMTETAQDYILVLPCMALVANWTPPTPPAPPAFQPQQVAINKGKAAAASPAPSAPATTAAAATKATPGKPAGNTARV